MAFLRRIGTAANWLTSPSRLLGSTAAEPRQQPDYNRRRRNPPTAPNRR